MNQITKTNGNHVPAIIEARLPCDADAAKRYGVEAGQWRVLVESVWPSAKTADAVFLALDYCRARKLDPFKRPCHIVPMWNSTLHREVETVWPGISDIRTTAARTTEYAGADETIFGQEATETFEGKTHKGEKLTATLTFPTWARITVYRIIKGQRVPFPGPRVIWKETYSQMKGTPVPNTRWQRAPYQMLEKCAEAAALRKAFPEELGSVYAAEEMEGRPIEADAVSYTDVREEARFIIAEMDSCPNRQRLDEYFSSASVKEFMVRAEGAAANKPSSINQGDVVTQFYHQIREKLQEEPEAPRNPMQEQDAGREPDVAPEAGSSTPLPASNQPPDIPPNLDRRPKEAELSAIAVKCMEQFDIVDDVDGYKAAQKFALENQKALTAAEKVALNVLSKKVGARLRESAA